MSTSSSSLVGDDARPATYRGTKECAFVATWSVDWGTSNGRGHSNGLSRWSSKETKTFGYRRRSLLGQTWLCSRRMAWCKEIMVIASTAHKEHYFIINHYLSSDFKLHCHIFRQTIVSLKLRWTNSNLGIAGLPSRFWWRLERSPLQMGRSESNVFELIRETGMGVKWRLHCLVHDIIRMNCHSYIQSLTNCLHSWMTSNRLKLNAS